MPHLCFLQKRRVHFRSNTGGSPSLNNIRWGCNNSRTRAYHYHRPRRYTGGFQVSARFGLLLFERHSDYQYFFLFKGCSYLMKIWCGVRSSWWQLFWHMFTTFQSRGGVRLTPTVFTLSFLKYFSIKRYVGGLDFCLILQGRTGRDIHFSFQEYLIQELISPLLTPYVLFFRLRPRAIDIVDFYRQFTIEVVGVGDVCSFAQMDIRKHGNPEWQPEGTEKVDAPVPSSPQFAQVRVIVMFDLLEVFMNSSTSSFDYRPKTAKQSCLSSISLWLTRIGGLRPMQRILSAGWRLRP